MNFIWVIRKTRTDVRLNAHIGTDSIGLKGLWRSLRRFYERSLYVVLNLDLALRFAAVTYNAVTKPSFKTDKTDRECLAALRTNHFHLFLCGLFSIHNATNINNIRKYSEIIISDYFSKNAIFAI